MIKLIHQLFKIKCMDLFINKFDHHFYGERAKNQQRDHLSLLTFLRDETVAKKDLTAEKVLSKWVMSWCYKLYVFMRRDCHRNGISRQGGMADHIFVLESIPASWVCIWKQRHQPPLLSFKLSVARSKITGHWLRPKQSFPRLVTLSLLPSQTPLGQCWMSIQLAKPFNASTSSSKHFWQSCHYASFFITLLSTRHHR